MRGSLLEQPVALALGAYPADAPLQVGGTLAVLRQRGWRTVLASLSAGQAAGAARPADERAGTWTALPPAAAWEGEQLCLNLPLLEICFSADVCRCVVALIRSVRPALVLTHAPDETLPESEQTSRIVRQACLAAPVAAYVTAGAAPEPTGRVPHLYYFDGPECHETGARPGAPLMLVDVSASRERKEQLLAGPPATAGPSGAPLDGARLEQARQAGRRRGEPVGWSAAEAVRQHVAAPFPRDNLLAGVLGPLVRGAGEALLPAP